MKNKALIHTNVIISVIIIIGFIATSIISYNSNIGMYKDNIKHVSTLASDSLYNKIESAISKPLHVSFTMSDDAFLKDYLKSGENNQNDANHTATLSNYLNVYKEKYGYDTVFLISSQDNKFYLYDGTSHSLAPAQEQDKWYYALLGSDSDYLLRTEPDLENGGDTRVFINCKITDTDGSLLGVVGVGFAIQEVQKILNQYSKEFAVSAYLTTPDGEVQIPYNKTQGKRMNLLDIKEYASYEDLLATDNTALHGAWYHVDGRSGYTSARYLENLGWNLIVSKDTDLVRAQFVNQLTRSVFVIGLILVVVIIIISRLIRHYNTRIIELTISQELEYYQLLQNTTEALYDYIFEVNVTQNKGVGDSVADFYKTLGIPEDTPFDVALKLNASQNIKPAFREKYLELFNHKSLLETYAKGITNLTYDYLYLDDPKTDTSHWIRLQAQLFFWNSDNSLHMIAYHQNIDGEKRRELDLIERSQRDSLTGLYNKRSAEELIAKTLDTPGKHAFIIIDVDNFKSVNDTMGHACGDSLLQELSSEIRANFHASDIAGRLGGDEFVVMMKNYGDIVVVRNKLSQLCERVRSKQSLDKAASNVSFSIGVAVFPLHGTTYSELYEKADQALYYSKGHGKDSFTIYGESFTSGTAFHVSQRDMDTLITSASDGIIKVAYGAKAKLLYFNQKRLNLTGTPADVLTAPGYHALDAVHPDDRARVVEELQSAYDSGSTFTVYYRLEKFDHTYIGVRLKGFFTHEMFEDTDPILYGIYEVTNDNP